MLSWGALWVWLATKKKRMPIANTNRILVIRILFSSEGDNQKQGDDCFMGGEN
jgi:hypothetical protein